MEHPVTFNHSFTLCFPAYNGRLFVNRKIVTDENISLLKMRLLNDHLTVN